MQLFEDQDAKPVYQGKATARGIKCDVWKQTRVNWPGEYKSRMIWRWYFTQSPQQPVRSRLSVHHSVISQYEAEVLVLGMQVACVEWENVVLAKFLGSKFEILRKFCRLCKKKTYKLYMLSQFFR